MPTNTRVFRFAVVGAFGVLVNIGITELLLLMGMHLTIAAAIGAAVSVVGNFLLLEHWTFHDRNLGQMWHRFTGFSVIGAIDYAIRAPFLVVLAELMPTALANLLTILAAFSLRYVLSASLVWRRSTDTIQAHRVL